MCILELLPFNLYISESVSRGVMIGEIKITQLELFQDGVSEWTNNRSESVKTWTFRAAYCQMRQCVRDGTTNCPSHCLMDWYRILRRFHTGL